MHARGGENDVGGGTAPESRCGGRGSEVSFEPGRAAVAIAAMVRRGAEAGNQAAV